MPRTSGGKGRWVVYQRRLSGPDYAPEIIYLSKFYSTKGEAEKAREKMSGLPEHERASLGVGFVRRKSS